MGPSATIDLGGDRRVSSVAFEAGHKLEGGTLSIRTGTVTVSSDVTATVNSDIDTPITKVGDGTLVIAGTAGDIVVGSGTLAGTGTARELTVESGGAVSPGDPNGTLSVNRGVTIDGTLLSNVGSSPSVLDAGNVVRLSEGSTLAVRAVESLKSTNETLWEVLRSDRRIEGKFSNEPLIGKHIGSGVFLAGPFGADSPVTYLNKSVTIWVVQATAGDANGDGSFNQQDIVLVLQAGKYMTGAAVEWTEGDFNGDGLFNQADIVAALQTGKYLAD
jgi:hypothetical protein